MKTSWWDLCETLDVRNYMMLQEYLYGSTQAMLAKKNNICVTRTGQILRLLIRRADIVLRKEKNTKNKAWNRPNFMMQKARGDAEELLCALGRFHRYARVPWRRWIPVRSD
jgi:hypothetical protein